MSKSLGRDLSESPSGHAPFPHPTNGVARSIWATASVSTVKGHIPRALLLYGCAAVLGIWIGQAAADSSGLEKVRELNAAGRYSKAEATARKLLAQAEAGSGETLETAHILDELSVALRRGSGVQSGDALAFCE